MALGSLAKVKVQIDLTKDRPPHVWMWYIGEDFTERRWCARVLLLQQYQGHLDHVCTINKEMRITKEEGTGS
ncbi:hypothetical protein H5410_057605 [Solanum commersonii]|uniref:Uncharacterized protein n=1 Tax=Solanum commersonii TaxID=4109 RepID=A0A9J5WQI2_SOLCO|nr:hypothetical protein H5410_057605 [Solanum commersonii]